MDPSRLIDIAANRALTKKEVESLRLAFSVRSLRGSSKRKPTKADMLKRPRWYKAISFWDGPARRVMTVDGHDVLVQGTLFDDELAVCLVPQAIGPTQGEALRALLEANLRMSVMLISNNIHLVRLAPVTEAEAGRIMKEFSDAQAHEATDGAAQPDEGEGVRAEGGGGSEADLRSAGGAGGDRGSDEGEPVGGDAAEPGSEG